MNWPHFESPVLALLSEAFVVAVVAVVVVVASTHTHLSACIVCPNAIYIHVVRSLFICVHFKLGLFSL